MFEDFHPNKCEVCGKVFTSPRGLASHTKSHQNDTECPVCLKKVRYMAPHMRKEHSDDPLYQLEAGISMLIAEVRRLRSDRNKPYGD